MRVDQSAGVWRSRTSHGWRAAGGALRLGGRGEDRCCAHGPAALSGDALGRRERRRARAGRCRAGHASALAWSGADGLIAAATGAIGAAWHISLAEPLPAPTDAEGWRARLVSPTSRHGDEVLAFGSDPDASFICTASKDGTVQVWDDRSGEVLLRPAPFRSPGGGRAVSREDDVIGASLERGVGGLRVLAVGRRGAAIWPLDVAGLASERAPRGLSGQERTPLELDEL